MCVLRRYTLVNVVCFVLVFRTLMGHKANICSVDFHPFGEYLASGSMDTNIKVTKACARVSAFLHLCIFFITF